MGFFSNKKNQIIYNTQLFLWNARLLGAQNIFDYKYNARKRWYKVGEVFDGNSAYSMGHILRRYSGYKGPVFLATEHGCCLKNDEENYSDLINHNRKIVCVASRKRSKCVRKMANKLYIPFGPSIIPFAEPLYNSLQIESIKATLGKTLLVFNLHSSPTVAFQGGDEFLVEEVEKIAKKYDYNTIIICIHYEDIIRGKAVFFEKKGWVVVTAGDKGNIDFADCLKTIFMIGDHVVLNGYGSPLGYAGYLKKPITVIPNKNVLTGLGSDEQIEWEQNHEKWALDLFGNYEEELDQEKYEKLAEEFGYHDVLDSDQIKHLLQFAREIEIYNGINKNRVKRIVSKRRYTDIKELVFYALEDM